MVKEEIERLRKIKAAYDEGKSTYDDEVIALLANLNIDLLIDALQMMPHLVAWDIANLLVTCFEGGSNYWIDKIQFVGNAKGSPWYDEPSNFEGEFKISFEIDGSIYELTPWTIRAGTALLIQHYPHRWSAIQSDDHDADDADVWLQLCLFGDVVYG